MMPELIPNNSIEELEIAMLSLPQVECPVVHHFFPGLYIRELTIPAGVLAIGHAQKYEHLNIILQGRVSMFEEGKVKFIKGPLMFMGQPGRKFGYVTETIVWQNIFPNPTNETDIEKLEAIFFEKSDQWLAHDKEQLKQLTELHVKGFA